MAFVVFSDWDNPSLRLKVGIYPPWNKLKNPKMVVSNRNLLFKGSIFRGKLLVSGRVYLLPWILWVWIPYLKKRLKPSLKPTASLHGVGRWVCLLEWLSFRGELLVSGSVKHQHLNTGKFLSRSSPNRDENSGKIIITYFTPWKPLKLNLQTGLTMDLHSQSLRSASVPSRRPATWPPNNDEAQGPTSSLPPLDWLLIRLLVLAWDFFCSFCILISGITLP